MKDQFAAIESDEFAAEANLASGLSDFLFQIKRSNAFTSLFRLASESSSAAYAILSRVLRLSKLSIDSRYENPFDTAVAVYLVILARAKPELAEIAATHAYHLQNSWWARKTAAQVLEESTYNSGAGSYSDLRDYQDSHIDFSCISGVSKISHSIPYDAVGGSGVAKSGSPQISGTK